MADINATDLTPETAATLDGSEEFVMFDNVEGKRGELDTVGDYIVQHCDADGNGNTAAQLAGGAQADATAALGDIGDILDLITTDKTDLVSAVNEVKGQADDNTTALQTKAEVDGAYEQMTVGNAEQLVSNIRVTDTDPYLFRTAGGSLEIGDREYPTLVGGTVAWNQWAKAINSTNWSAEPNVTATFTDGEAEFTSTAVNYGIKTNAGAHVKQSHIYYITMTIKSDTASNCRLLYGGNGGAGKDFDTTTSYEKKTAVVQSNGTGVQIYVFPAQQVGVNVEFNVKNVQVFDLTQMLGTAIADYIYTLEQGTAGAGVAFCKKYGIGVGYTAYNAGTLQSTTPTKHKTVGFNQWDEEWEVIGDHIGSKNPIPCLPNTTYYFNAPASPSNGWRFYDENMNQIGGAYWNGGLHTSPEGARYMLFQMTNAYGTTYNHDICINLHWDGERDGEYEPYTKHEYDLGNDTLRGVFELNNGELKANGDVKTADGTITRRFGIVDLGTLNWTYRSEIAAGMFSGVISGNKAANTLYALCSKYEYAGAVGGIALAHSKDKTLSLYTGGGVVYVYDTAYTSKNAFVTAMSGVYLIYELATPTEEEGTAFQSPQIVSNWGTEEYTEANGIVVGHSTEYPQDLKAKVESAPNNPSADGDYIVKRENGENAYVPLVIPQELPNAPSTDGTYRLKCTVSGGAATYSWEA